MIDHRARNQKAAREEILQKCRDFTAQYHAAGARIDAARAAIRSAEEEKSEFLRRIQDCLAAARVLDFDLASEMKNGDSAAVPLAEPIKSPENQQKMSQTIRDLVLEAAHQAFPNPIRASAVRKDIERLRGSQLHEKTIGMTLYRLSQEGLVRRSGIDWFFCDGRDGSPAKSA
jgi:hypothetical protein